MKNTLPSPQVLQHPDPDDSITIHAWQVNACGGNSCAAALLSLLISGHYKRVEQAKKQHGGNVPRECLYQPYTLSELENGAILFGRRSIAKGVHTLVELGFVSIERNPDPLCGADRTRHFLVNASRVNAYLKSIDDEALRLSRERRFQD